MQNDPQLLLYFYAMSKMFPDFPNRIMSIFFFYKEYEGNPDPVPYSLFDKSDEARFLDMLRSRVEEIRQNVSPKPLDPTEQTSDVNICVISCKNNFEGETENMCIITEKHLKEHGMQETVKVNPSRVQYRLLRSSGLKG